MPIDYNAIAQQFGATSSQPAAPSTGSPIDYNAVARQFGATSSQPTAPSMAQQVGDFLDHNPIADTIHGVTSGIAATGLGAYNLLRKIPGVDKILPEPDASWNDAATTPPGFLGHAGRFIEQAGEFMVPLGEVAKAIEGTELAVKAAKAGSALSTRIAASAAKTAAEAATSGGVAAVQTGGDPKAIAETALTTGALGAAGSAIPAGAKALIRAVVPRLEASGQPLSAAAEELADKMGVPLTAGMRTGSPALQHVEGTLGNTVAPDLYRGVLEGARKAINAGAQDLSGGFATDRFSAGDTVMKTMLSKADEFKAQAQTEYDNLARIEADPANTRTVQVGIKKNPAMPSLDPEAPDLPATVPDMQSMGLPVDMRPAKAVLAPEVDNMLRFMSKAQKNADDGLSAIQNILTRPDHLPASVAEGDLSYLKSVLRGNSTPQSKRLAGKAIDAMEPQIQAAVSQAGPDATAALNDARGAWQARSSILDQLDDLSSNLTGKDKQVQVANRLLQPADASFPALSRVLIDAPEAAEPLGKAYLATQVFKGAADGEDVTPKQASNLWNQMGPRTKAALYSPEQIANVDAFMTLAKRVAENPGLSKGGLLHTLLKVGVFTAHPAAGPASFVLGRNVAKVLYSPQGVAALEDALRAPGSAKASTAMTLVKSIIDGTETAQP